MFRDVLKSHLAKSAENETITEGQFPPKHQSLFLVKLIGLNNIIQKCNSFLNSLGGVPHSQEALTTLDKSNCTPSALTKCENSSLLGPSRSKFQPKMSSIKQRAA